MGIVQLNLGVNYFITYFYENQIGSVFAKTIRDPN